MSSSLCSEATSTEERKTISEADEGSVNQSGAAIQEDLRFSLDNLSLLVEDIKEGFSATMQQLGRIDAQDGDLRSRLDSVELTASQKIDGLEAVVQQMRDQFASVVTRVESLELQHRKLEGQVDQLDRTHQAAAERQKISSDCCHHPGAAVYDARAASCQTPVTPYSCATPLSPDSGRPGTCTPSCCYHSNEFQSGDNIKSDTVDSVGKPASTTVATVAPVNGSSATSRPPPTCHRGGGGGAGSGGGCSAIAEKSLHMSRALLDRFAHADSSGEDCELDSLAEAPADQLSDSTAQNGAAKRSPDGARGTVGPTQVRQVAPHERSLRQDRRRRVCQEIVETERKYCSCLWTIIDLIAESLKSASFVTMKDLCLIFPKCLPRLYELHSTFLGLLETRLAAEVETHSGSFEAPDLPTSNDDAATNVDGTFSAVFLEFLDANNGELFNLYRDYANDFSTAVQTIRKYQLHSGRFRTLLHSLQHHPSCEGLDLTAFLLTPVQRMPRYLLLMRQLSVHTQAGHRDLGCLDCVLDRLHCLLDELNYSIQTALRQAAAGTSNSQQHQQQQQQQQRWKRSRSLSRSAEVASSYAALSANADADSLLSGSSGRSSSGSRHFLATTSVGVAASSTSSTTTAPASRRARFAAAASTARCRSVPPQQQQQQQHQRQSQIRQQQQQQQQQQRAATPTRTESPSMGPRSRFISRQLGTADRCMSASDILRASPAPSSTASTASPLAFEERVQQRMMRRGTPPKSTTLKESFKRMFQSRRKSSLAKLESTVPGCSTFEDENGDPCTDV